MKKIILLLTCGMVFCTGTAQTLPKWASQAKKAVFSVITYNKDNKILNTGNGFYIDEEGTIYIDGEVLNENFGKEVIQDPGRAYETITLGEDEYFVLGDNRNNSSDSRDPVVGNIHRNELIGKAWMRIYPFNQMCIIKHQ